MQLRIHEKARVRKLSLRINQESIAMTQRLGRFYQQNHPASGKDWEDLVFAKTKIYRFYVSSSWMCRESCPRHSWCLKYLLDKLRSIISSCSNEWLTTAPWINTNHQELQSIRLSVECKIHKYILTITQEEKKIKDVQVPRSECLAI